MTIEPIQPILSDLNRPFWDAIRADRLVFQQCSNCRHLRYPIATTCPRCLDQASEWTEVSGSGEVLSVMIFHRAYRPWFEDKLPYNVVLVGLDEGPRMFSNVVNQDNNDIRVGQRVQLECQRLSDEFWIPRFRRAVGPSGFTR